MLEVEKLKAFCVCLCKPCLPFSRAWLYKTTENKGNRGCYLLYLISPKFGSAPKFGFFTNII